MKNFYPIMLLFFFSVSSLSQSWQWTKRGGASDALTSNDGREAVYAMVTDSFKNVYMLSKVGYYDLNIDGVPKQNWSSGSDYFKEDIVLASFSCNGTYRWSKVIGGKSNESVRGMTIDAQNNIYIAGRFGDGNAAFPPRIDNDIIIPQNPEDYSLTFLAKYDFNGNFQWLKRPQASTVSFTDGYSNTGTRGLATDYNGTLYWLVQLPVGVYANGAFNCTTAGNYILKYNAAGAFLGAIPFDMQLTGAAGANLKFYRNPISGNFFVICENAISNSTTVLGGQFITKSFYLACFSPMGQLLWKRENTKNIGEGGIYPYGISFDENSNIILAGAIFGWTNGDSFLGFTKTTPGRGSFVMKLNPTAETVLWSTNNNVNGIWQEGGVTYNPIKNEIGITALVHGTNVVWGTQSIASTPIGLGLEVLFARFNPATGACLGLHKISNNNNGFAANGTAVTFDASGDYLVGGGFNGTIYPTATTTVVDAGSQSDFFVAKFATQACSSLATENFDKTELQVYPNPTTGLITIAVLDKTTFEIFDIAGKQLLKGVLSVSENTIDMRAFERGVYFLKIAGVVKKVVKE